MMFSKELEEQIQAYLEENHQAVLDFLETLVNLEGCHKETARLRRTAAFLYDSFASLGLNPTYIEVGEDNAPVVTGVLHPQALGKALVFSGHYDTVFAAGSWGDSPFHLEDGKAYGPGVCDMKGGITIAFFVVKALKELGFTGCPVRLLFVGDEEVNHQGGHAIDVIQDYTKDSLVTFNMENRYETGQACIGRKGSYEYVVRVHGVAAHPGHAYDEGRNAIEEMAYKVIALQACTPKERTRTFSVNVGTIRGGTVTNGVPAYCEVHIDTRVATMADVTECERRMRAAVAPTFVPDTTTELLLLDAMPPFETTAAVLRAYNALQAISDAVDGPMHGCAVVGGASDAAYIAAAGSPVVCQCGVTGAFTHNEKEYANVQSLYDTIRLFIHVAYNYQAFQA